MSEESIEPRDIDPRDNVEVRTVQSSGSRENARATDSGPAPTPARAADDPLGLQDEAADGTGQGDPTAGVRISEEDVAEAVPADDGPEGTR